MSESVLFHEQLLPKRAINLDLYMIMKHNVLYSAKRYEGSSLIIIGGSSEEIHFTKHLLLQGEGRWHVITSIGE